ncbi:MAG: hypothetical protein IPP72_00505 [Chitinophagaceae bacterium]|nr:hypothetical protein [Chitinophagaceae bacterium]
MEKLTAQTDFAIPFFQYSIKLNFTKQKKSVMKNLLLLLGVCLTALLTQTNVQAQNIFSGEPVQVVGQMNGYSSAAAANSVYRRVSVSSGTPTDGRGQWMKTYNAQSSGGDVLNSNMPGGGGNGFLFISGPSSNRFLNKWVFSGVGQGTVNAINNISAFNSGNDMGLNMSTAGRYTFVFNDAGYTTTNARYYVGYTANAPVTVTNGGTTFSNSQPVISITTSAAPSAGENVYVRYRATTNDFTTGTSVVQATGSGTAWSATLPQQTCGSTVFYYVYTSTRSLAQINGDSESDRFMGALRYDDNAGANYSFSVSPVPTAGITNNSATTVLTCVQTSISVTATGGASYSWDNGLGSGASKSITVPGTYTVTVTGANGCTSTAQIIVTQNITTPTAGITNNSGTTIITCAQPSISVTATGGVSYLWDNGLGSGASKTINAAGTYTVTVTGSNGCTSTAQIVVTQNFSNNTFTGTGDWTDNARWSCGAPPSSSDNVTIAAGANATLNTNFIVSGSLTMTATSTLTVNPTRTLSVDVAATANFNGQSVTFKSDATGTASLGQVNGTLSGATNVTVERYIPNNGFRSWRLLSVPTFGSGQTIRQAWQEGTANPLPQQNNLPNYGTQITGFFSTQSAAAAAGFDSITINAGMLTWNGASWSNVTSTNVALATNKSYFLYIRGERSKSVSGAISNSSATTLRNTGTVYTGDQTTNVGAGAFALVPNLYPSAINFTGLTRTGGVNNLFYIWDSKKLSGNSLGVYQTFSGTNSFNCLISGGSYTLGLPNTTIESGQSFFVTSGAAGTIVLKESAKLSGTNGSLGFRPSANPSRIDSRLYNTNNEMLDANVVVFDAAYDRAVDADDAVKYGNPGANFAIETGSKILAIEGTQPVKENDAIQFRMWNLQQQDYRLEFATTKMEAAGMEAVLEDSYLKTTTAVNLKGSTTVNFTVTADAASKAANRFRIAFRKVPVTVDVKQGYTIAPNPVTGGSMNLQFNAQPAGRYSIRIIGMNGQSALTKVISHAGGTAVQSVNLGNLANGTYQVEIVAPGKTRSMKTLFVNKK